MKRVIYFPYHIFGMLWFFAWTNTSIKGGGLHPQRHCLGVHSIQAFAPTQLHLRNPFGSLLRSSRHRSEESCAHQHGQLGLWDAGCQPGLASEWCGVVCITVISHYDSKLCSLHESPAQRLVA